MGGQTVMIVPATVPNAVVQRVPPSAPAGPTVISAEPKLVPPARAVPVIPEQLTAEQVAQLRAENTHLRNELERVRRVS